MWQQSKQKGCYPCMTCSQALLPSLLSTSSLFGRLGMAPGRPTHSALAAAAATRAHHGGRQIADGQARGMKLQQHSGGFAQQTLRQSEGHAPRTPTGVVKVTLPANLRASSAVFPSNTATAYAPVKQSPAPVVSTTCRAKTPTCAGALRHWLNCMFLTENLADGHTA